MAIHPPFLLFPLNISRVDGIYYTIIITLEMEAPILLQGIGFALLVIFLGGGSLQIFINVSTEFPHRRRLPVSRRLIRRVTKVLLKILPIVDGLPIVNPSVELGLAVENFLFLQAFNFGPVPLAFTQRGKEGAG